MHTRQHKVAATAGGPQPVWRKRHAQYDCRYDEVLQMARNHTAIVLPAFKSDEESVPIEAITGGLPTFAAAIKPGIPTALTCADGCRDTQEA